MNVCVPHAWLVPLRPEEGKGKSETGVTDGHEPLWILTTKFWSSAMAVKDLNGCTISLAPQNTSD